MVLTIGGRGWSGQIVERTKPIQSESKSIAEKRFILRLKKRPKRRFVVKAT